MPGDAASLIAYVGLSVAVFGGCVSLYNSRKAVQWKRAELANSYIKDFNSNAELVFAGRCLDWFGGPLIVPESLRPFLPSEKKTIDHDRLIFKTALRSDLTIDEMTSDPRLQLYRIAIDSFLSWLCLVSSALDRNLFKAADIEDVGYWVAKIESDTALHSFIEAFGYGGNIKKLTKRFREEKNSYQAWRFPTIR